MPELPEVETMRRGVAPLRSARIHSAEVPVLNVQPIEYVPPPDELCRRLAGRQIEDVDRVGKRLLIQLDNGEVLLIEPRMTGRVLVDPPDNLSHVRLKLRLCCEEDRGSGRQHLLIFRDTRGLGIVRLITEEECRRELGPDKIGPDALAISWAELRDRLRKRRCAIKVALMDQSVLAGVGNIYASEALHLAKVHPQLPCCHLSSSQWRTLTESLHQVLRDAIALQGSTLGDGTYTTPENTPGSYQNEHRVYQREGQKCQQCGRGIIRRIVLAQRSTFFCPVCQRLPVRLRQNLS
ncbi:bifunctional DNA-formamidopyrimidine glycosylase/DNA-(apurinic or apyrimidinic site) lyase [Thermogutta sp.]|uniref:bifunctional DNA-formamidopyrimidine glycosylase/DNA-(apurinic or apyrimidinic site) lyase n=1 Tax=Thermogutta sp. TaxID=1962930 RepID=UPI00321FA68C